MWKSAPTGSSSLTQPAAGLHRGTGARRNEKAEDHLHLSDPAPYHWIQTFALAITPADPSGATRKNRAMIQVQKCRDEQTTGKNFLSKNPTSCLKLLILCYPATNSTPISVNYFYIKSI